MIYIKECDLKDFDFWSGAVDTANELSDKELETVEARLDDVWMERPPTETDINDFFWFEEDTIADWLGFASWEELVEYHREEEE